MTTVAYGLGLPYETPGETAAEHAASLVPVARPESTAGEIRAAMEGQRWDCATDVAICDGDRLVGLVSIESLMAAASDSTAREIMDSDPPRVWHGIDQELAAWKAIQHGESSLAVVDEDGRFVGLVPPRRLLAVFLREHEEDMARIGGFVRGASAAIAASQEPVWLRFWHKIPWLALGLVGALVAADIVGAFEGQLEENVMLAFFLPGIVYLADAVGTQTETLVIRGLSVNVPIGGVVRKELVTGVLVGLALGLTFLPLGIWRWGDGEVALTVSLSLVAACSMATVVAMLLPAVFHRLGRDPAFGSGPLATVIQDLLSIVIYLGIASVIVSEG
jgi:magnesium transporter